MGKNILAKHKTSLLFRSDLLFGGNPERKNLKYQTILDSRTDIMATDLFFYLAERGKMSHALGCTQCKLGKC